MLPERSSKYKYLDSPNNTGSLENEIVHYLKTELQSKTGVTIWDSLADQKIWKGLHA